MDIYNYILTNDNILLYINKMEILDLPTIGFSIESNPYNKEILISSNYHYNINKDIDISTFPFVYNQFIASGNYSKFPSIVSRNSLAFKFSIDMHYLTENRPPNYYDLLEACGWYLYNIMPKSVIVETDGPDIINIEVGIDRVHVFRILTSVGVLTDSYYNRRPATIEVAFPEFDITPRQHVTTMYGGMGTTIFRGKTGSPCNIEFNFLGCHGGYSTRNNEDIIVPSGFDTALPKALMSATAYLHNNEIYIDEFEITCGNVLSLFSDIFSPNGYNGTRITDRFATGVLTIHEDSDNIETVYNKIKTNKTGTLTITNGGLALHCSGVQLKAINNECTKYSIDINETISLAQKVT